MARPSVPHPCNSSSSAAGSPPRRSVASVSPSPPAWRSAAPPPPAPPEPRTSPSGQPPRPDPCSGQRRPAAGELLRRPAELVRRPRHRPRHPLGLGVGPRLRDGGLGRRSPARRRATRSSSAGSASTTPSTSSTTGTNVQEAGVDEPDTVKTDGRLLVRVLDDRTLVVYDVTGTEPVRLGSLSLTGVDAPELLLAGDRVVVIGHDADCLRGTDRTRHPRAGRRCRRPRQPHRGPGDDVRLQPGHGPPARRRDPAGRLGRPAEPGLRRARPAPLRELRAEAQPGDRQGQHAGRLAAARDHRRG